MKHYQYGVLITSKMPGFRM